MSDKFKRYSSVAGQNGPFPKLASKKGWIYQRVEWLRAKSTCTSDDTTYPELEIWTQKFCPPFLISQGGGVKMCENIIDD